MLVEAADIMVLNLLLFAIVTLYGVSALILYLLRAKGASTVVRRVSEASAWMGFALGLLWSFQTFSASPSTPDGFFHAEPLQALLVPYMLLMGVLVKRFAYHYLQTDTQYPLFFLKIKLLMASLLLFVLSNHALVTVGTWIFSGIMMALLIAHAQTPAARNSARMALNRFLIGDFFMVVGVAGLIVLSDSFFLSDWFALGVSHAQDPRLMGALLCVALGAFSKTAIVPFQKWLAHTLAAPTPVSAIMHAGFVNAGAILFAKLAPLLQYQPVVLAFVLLMGLVSALYGSTVMLVQTDVKRYLTFSTVGQMGFMMMECGLGAYHLAIFHLIVHGFFKARMFLAAGSVIEYRSAILNAKAQKAAFSSQSASLAQRLKTAALIAASVSFSWGLLFQVEMIRNQVFNLPALLLVVLVLSSLFIQTTILKNKGTGLKGLSIATAFNLLLVAFYLLYELVAVGTLPAFHQAFVALPSEVLTAATVLLASAGGLTWLSTLGLLPLPTVLTEKYYVSLLNATGGNPRYSTFSARA